MGHSKKKLEFGVFRTTATTTTLFLRLRVDLVTN
jgi:hypothetical protein